MCILECTNVTSPRKMPRCASPPMRSGSLSSPSTVCPSPTGVSKSGNNSFTATAHNGCKSLFLSSVKKKNMKGCSLFNAKYYLCNRNSERSLVIQNNELSRISLISKSLPIQPVFNRRVLCFKHLAQYHIFLPDSNINFIFIIIK